MKIYNNQFQSRDIKTIDSKVSGLTYYQHTRTYPRPGHSSGHILSIGGGVCAPWAEFFREVAAVHGIPVAKVDIHALGTTSPTATANSAKTSEFHLHTIPLTAPSGYPKNVDADNFPNSQYSSGSEVLCQGGKHTKREWSGHSISEYTDPGTSDKHYYDPSYGTGIRNGLQEVNNWMLFFSGNTPPTGAFRVWMPGSSTLDIKL